MTFDKDGVYINPSSYSGIAYPGGLTSNNVLTISSFSGSDTNYIVGSITYTIEDKEEIETITRFEDGEPTHFDTYCNIKPKSVLL